MQEFSFDLRLVSVLGWSVMSLAFELKGTGFDSRRLHSRSSKSTLPLRSLNIEFEPYKLNDIFQ